MTDPVAESKTSNLREWGRRTKAALKDALEVMGEADRARLGAIYGAIGLLSSGAGTIVLGSALAINALFFVSPLVAGAGGLIGMRLSYSKDDIQNKRTQSLIQTATEQRDEEIEKLDVRIRKLEKSDPAAAAMLKKRRLALSMASNDHLLRWAKLIPANEEIDQYNPLLAAPSSANLGMSPQLQTHAAPTAQISSSSAGNQT